MADGLPRYMDKRLQLQLNANRRVSGVLRGYDAFLNIVLDEAVEEVSPTERRSVGMVVRPCGWVRSVSGCVGGPWQ